MKKINKEKRREKGFWSGRSNESGTPLLSSSLVSEIELLLFFFSNLHRTVSLLSFFYGYRKSDWGEAVNINKEISGLKLGNNAVL